MWLIIYYPNDRNWMMTIASKLLVLFCLLVAFVEGDTNGFMELNLLKRRAEKISNAVISQNFLDGNFRLVTGMSFACSGSLTGLLLGVDVRPGGGRSQYPEVQIWRRRGGGNNYDRQGTQPISLAAGNFSPDGVLQYNLNSALSFLSGDVLGVWQPSSGSSVVRLFHDGLNGGPSSIETTSNPGTSINTNGLASSTTTILIHAVTTDQSCTSGFPSPEELRQKALQVNINSVIIRNEQQRVFPNINFTASGSITKWIVGAGTGGGSSPPSELQIWRRSGSDYTKVGSTQLTAQSPTVNLNVYEYIPSPPLGFQEGDILGVYQRNDSSVVPYYQENTGPENLRQSGLVSTAPDSLTAPPLAVDQYEYPLVTVEIGPPLTSSIPVLSTTESDTLVSSTVPVLSTTAALVTSITPVLSTTAALVASITPVLSTTAALVTSITPVLSTTVALVISNEPFLSSTNTFAASITPVISTTAAALVTASVPVPSSKDTLATSITSALSTSTILTPILSKFPESGDTSLMGTRAMTSIPMPSSTADTLAQQDSAGVIAAVVIVLIVIAALVAVGVVIGLLVVLRRKKKEMLTFYHEDTDLNLNDITNPTYASPSTNSNQPLMELYSVPDAAAYETPFNTLPSKAGAYEKPGSTMSQYLTPGSTINSNNSSYQWGVVVPTMSQRKYFTGPSSHYEMEDEIYSTIAQDENYQTLNNSFFEEEVIYWEPGSDCASIYEQLSRNKYREIIREQIQVKEHLGSGQFGQVDKGIWSSPDGPVDVAIKTLRSEASEEEKIKFLQEAAIMGQFHHANIVILHGMVTVTEPTMIVLELVKNGDLREYLHTLRPTPGEMAPSSLPQQLLGYCRQIASGMEYLSKKKFVHRDLAARNILVDDKKTCKIADFGMSRDLSDSDYYVSQGGKIPIKWTAPEALCFKKYSTASDVWSYGALMYEIWSLGHKPFEGKTNNEAVRLIDTGYRLPPPPGCPRAVYQIMMDCWHPEASGRLSFGIIASRLSQPETRLLKWSDTITHDPQSTMLGAPLESAYNLHSDLQQQYM